MKRDVASLWPCVALFSPGCNTDASLGLYTILPLPILYGMYAIAINDGGGGTVLCNSVGDAWGGVGCPNKGGVCE